MSSEASITIGELEANYQLYCKAMKMLIAEKRTLNKIQRTVCWARLETLASLPATPLQIAAVSLRAAHTPRAEGGGVNHR